MMITYRLVLKTDSPLVMGSRQAAQGGATESLDHIPGSVLRGALAAAVLRQGHSNTSALFQTLFEKDMVRYGNLYPIIEGARISWPLPLTAWSCKIQPGFLPDPTAMLTGDEGHGVLDTLTMQLDGRAWQPAHDHCDQPNCRSLLEPLSGYYTQKADGTYVQPRHSRRLITRTAMAGRWGSARPGFLHTVEAIEEEQTFAGLIHVADDVAQSVEDALLAVRSVQGLRLGLGRSRGLGQVSIVNLNPVSGHLGFSRPLAERWRTPDLRAHISNLSEARFAFAITLYSDAILLDDYGRYQTSLNHAVLARVLRYAKAAMPDIERWPQSIRYYQGWAAVRSVHNWRFVPGWRKRTAEELAVMRGSVFVFTAWRDEEPAVRTLLQHLEETGIGRRREEGFGQIIVGHPWHEEGKR